MIKNPFRFKSSTAAPASSDISLVLKGLHYKIKSRAKLSPAEQHLARSVSQLRSNLFAPSKGETVREIIRVLLKPSLCGAALTAAFVLYPGNNISFADNFSGLLASVNEALVAPPEEQEDEELLALNSEEGEAEGQNLDLPQLAMAIAAEYDQASSEDEELLKQLVAAPAPEISHAIEVAKTINEPKALQVIPATAQALPTEHAGLKHQRNLVKFISGLIAAYRPTIKDCGGIAKEIVELSVAEKIDPIYVTSIIATESRFASDAQSYAGARGLMQLIPSTARQVAKEERRRLLLDEHLNDPKTNIRLGISYLKQLEERYRGNRYLALAAYNWGPGNVDKSKGGAKRIPGSVSKYSTSILERTVSWRRHFLRAVDTADDIQIALPSTAAHHQG